MVEGVYGAANPDELAQLIAESLKGQAANEQARAEFEAAQKDMERAKTAVRKKLQTSPIGRLLICSLRLGLMHVGLTVRM